MTDLNDPRHAALQAALEPGESLQWSGIPQGGGGFATWLPGCGGVMFLLMGLVTLFLGWGSLNSDFQHIRSSATLWLTLGGVFTLLALGMLVVPFVWRARIRRSIWGVTDRRIVRVIDRAVLAIRPDQVERVRTKGDTVIVTGHLVRPRLGGKQAASRPVWHIPQVTDAAAAERAIAALLPPG